MGEGGLDWVVYRGYFGVGGWGGCIFFGVWSNYIVVCFSSFLLTTKSFSVITIIPPSRFGHVIS